MPAALSHHANPFALMLDPQAVIAQVEASQRLGGLASRICRPLDRPLLSRPGEPGWDGADSTDTIDLSAEGADESDAADDGTHAG